MKKSKNERRKKTFEKKIRNFFKILGKNAHFFRNVTVQRFFERSIFIVLSFLIYSKDVDFIKHIF